MFSYMNNTNNSHIKMFLIVFIVIYWNIILAKTDTIMEFHINHEGNRVMCHSKSHTITVWEGEPLTIQVNNEYNVIQDLVCEDGYTKGRYVTLSNFTSYNNIFSAHVDRVPNYGNFWNCNYWSNNNIYATCSIQLNVKRKSPILEFTISWEGNKVQCNSDYMTAMEGETLRLRANNERDVLKALKCSVPYSRTEIQISEVSKANNQFSAIVEKVPNYGNVWTCEFWDDSNILTSCYVRFHLRTLDPTARLYLNRLEVVATPSHPSEWRYDALASYAFVDNEGVIIDCAGAINQDLVRTKIQLFNAKGDTMLAVERLYGYTTLYLKLTRSYDKCFVECKYETRSNNNDDTSTTRLALQLLDPAVDQSIIALHINGVRIGTRTSYYYQHFYHKGKNVNIACQVKNDSNAYLLPLSGLQDGSRQHKLEMTRVLNDRDNKTTYTCTALDNLSNIYISRVTVQIVEIKHDFYITGLSDGNILKRYEDTFKSTIIYYEYIDGEHLTLNCTKLAHGSNLKWTKNGHTIKSTDDSSHNSRYHTFLLAAKDDKSKIGCTDETDNSTITIMLICIEAPVTVAPLVTSTEYGEINKTNNNNTNGSGSNKKQEHTFNWTYVAIGIVVLIFIIIIIITSIIISSKRNKRQSTESDYTNLPKSDAKSDGNYENLNTDKEDPVLNYAEILHTNNNAKYNKCEVPDYAQIIAKGDRKENDYENTCQGARYVNSRSGEDIAEPAYCEVILPRT